MKRRIVISGVNFTEAGPLTVFRDALAALARGYAERYEIVALVHSRDLFVTEGVTYVEVPGPKYSWWKRLRFEYWECRRLSRQWRPALWLAMHDITPNVEAQVRAVYCHNPAPFYRFSREEATLDWRFGMFTLFYRYLYRINIRRNAFVVVQQEWLRREFQRRYGVERVVVAHPRIEALEISAAGERVGPGKVCRFFYPAFPRTFKNFEVLLEATRLLEARGAEGFEVWVTLAGRENAYAAKLYNQFRKLRQVRWLGLLPRTEVLRRYGEADCLVFASKLETWGMPISEFAQTGKPMLVADLPYAHETVGTYGAVGFFAPGRAQDLAGRMEEFLTGQWPFASAEAAVIAEPFERDWDGLFRRLVDEAERRGLARYDGTGAAS